MTLAGSLSRWLVLGTAILSAGSAAAEPTVSFAKWIQEIKVSGDLRLREEFFDRDTQGQVDRSRQRFRLRLNTDWIFSPKWTARVALASGSGEQVSTNQSFDNLSSGKDIWIDKVYASWRPFEQSKVSMGKMDNPLWRPVSAEAVCDTDLNPEGLGENVEVMAGDIRMFVNALQFAVDEDSGANAGTGEQADQWEFSEQLGIEAKMGDVRLKAAAANHYWKNENQGTFSQVVSNEGNRRSGGVLLNNFNVNEYTGEATVPLGNIPLSVQGTVVNNRGARDDLGSRLNDGYQVGAIVGRAREKGTWEAAYFNKWIQQDATVADVADADFGDGGTNRKGDIYWIAYAPHDWMVVQVKHSITDIVTKSEPPSVGAGTTNLGERIGRTQFDVVLKF